MVVAIKQLRLIPSDDLFKWSSKKTIARINPNVRDKGRGDI